MNKAPPTLDQNILAQIDRTIKKYYNVKNHGINIHLLTFQSLEVKDNKTLFLYERSPTN